MIIIFFLKNLRRQVVLGSFVVGESSAFGQLFFHDRSLVHRKLQLNKQVLKDVFFLATSVISDFGIPTVLD